MPTINASEFKAKCLALLDRVAETGEILTILKRGRAVARLVPAPASDDSYPQRSLPGSVEILGDVVEPVFPPDAWDAVRSTVRRICDGRLVSTLS